MLHVGPAETESFESHGSVSLEMLARAELPVRPLQVVDNTATLFLPDRHTEDPFCVVTWFLWFVSARLPPLTPPPRISWNSLHERWRAPSCPSPGLLRTRSRRSRPGSPAT